MADNVRTELLWSMQVCKLMKHDETFMTGVVGVNNSNWLALSIATVFGSLMMVFHDSLSESFPLSSWFPTRSAT